MTKLTELQDALKKSTQCRDMYAEYRDDLINAERSLDIAIDNIYIINEKNSTGISTEPLHEMLCSLQDRIKSSITLLHIAERNVTSASDALNAFDDNHKAQLQKDRTAQIRMDSNYTAIKIEFSTIDLNKVTVRLENGSIVEVFFEPDTDVINYDLSKSYFHTARNVW